MDSPGSSPGAAAAAPRQGPAARVAGPDRLPGRDQAARETRMGLKIELKPGERVMLGECVITNHDQRTRLLVEGIAPILREKDIMSEARANTPAKRIYLTVQLMYMSKDAAPYHELYFRLVREI